MVHLQEKTKTLKITRGYLIENGSFTGKNKNTEDY